MSRVDLTQALFDRLSTVPDVVAGLATYTPDGGPARPAIFTAYPVPANADVPYIVTIGEVAVTPADQKDRRGREIIRDVLIVDADDGSGARIEDLAETVRAVLHGIPLTIPGGTAIVSEVVGPLVGPAEDGRQSRALSLRIQIEEE